MAEPVLVHNQSSEGFFCPVIISFDQVPRLLDVQNTASPSTVSGLRAVLDEYVENGEAVLAKQVVDLIANAGTLDEAIAIARGAGKSRGATRELVEKYPDVAQIALASPNYVYAVQDVVETSVLRFAARISDLPVVEQRRLMGDFLASDQNNQVLFELARMDPGDELVAGIASRLAAEGFAPVSSASIDVADALATYERSTGSFDAFTDVALDLTQAGRARTSTITRNRITGWRFEFTQGPQRPVNQLYLRRGTDDAGKPLYYIVDAYDPDVGIYSLKSFQLDRTSARDIISAITESVEKYPPGKFGIAEVPSLAKKQIEAPGVPLAAGDELRGDLYLEVPVQRAGAFTGAKKTEVCAAVAEAAAQVLADTDGAFSFFFVDADGMFLCP